MTQANTGSGINPRAAAAAAEALRKAADGIGGVRAALVYCGGKLDCGDVVAGARAGAPGVPFAGCVSEEGVLLPEGFVVGDFVGALALSDPDLVLGTALLERTPGKDPREMGVELARAAMEKAGRGAPPHYYCLLAAQGCEEEYIKGISLVCGRKPFFGCASSRVFTDAGVTDRGAAVAFFYTPKPVTNRFAGGYAETGRGGVITAVRGERIIESMDGIPALTLYAEWIGRDAASLKGAAVRAAAVRNPLGIKDRLGDLTAVRNILYANDDGSIEVGNRVAAGTAALLLEGGAEGFAERCAEEIGMLRTKMTAYPGRSYEPAAFHLTQSADRLRALGERTAELEKRLLEAAGGAPFIMNFSEGEFGLESEDRNSCGSLMLSFSGFAK